MSFESNFNSLEGVKEQLYSEASMPPTPEKVTILP